ncbi:hypothetical protein ASPZODRAFT_63861 [Penicilliopsis zonata CBS 506.65]|uniref:HNH nuclease domain-containing protein n=1 Tax=Penicilliopsis zonata CBS 506.65 TaxID=1073090 RepID=A0A1L9SKK8_9EURO|nr:hypothetical protein ASPZODRAFT_63861 [Penicilliopsis zonata CBS 506.65]OJJ47740.1 hypothetical protein ASPZODRAFT_63861 [Penicilliopsis zonata CBS 506.65]
MPHRGSVQIQARHEAQPAGSCPPPIRPLRGLSAAATDKASSEARPGLVDAAKERVGNYQAQNRPNEDKLQPGLLAFLEWLPDHGCISLARDILKLNSDKDLYDVYHNLLTALATPMKARSKQGSITASPHPKRQNNVDIAAITLDEPQTCLDAFRDQCLKRDSHRCVVTGEMENDRWYKEGASDDVHHGFLEAAHIIPFAYASWDSSSRPPEKISIQWEALWRYFPEVRRLGMQVETINNLYNGITLSSYIHAAFGQFHIAFKPTDTENVYERKIYRRFPSLLRRTLPESNRIEILRAEDAQDFELPNATLLDCHWRLAEILNASGMAEIIDRNRRDWEDLKGSAGGQLREDGGTDFGQYLRVALWERMVS